MLFIIYNPVIPSGFNCLCYSLSITLSSLRDLIVLCHSLSIIMYPFGIEQQQDAKYSGKGRIEQYQSLKYFKTRFCEIM